MSAVSRGWRPHPPGQQQIFRAAVESFHRKGYEGSSVREISDRAGVTPAALYHYYSSKQDLLVDIIGRFVQRSIEVTREAVEQSGGTAAERLFAAARSHVLWNASDVASSFVANSEIRSLEPANRSANIARRDELQGIFDAIVQEGAESGEFAVPWPLEASRAVVVMCTFVARWYRASGPLTPEAVADRYGHMALSLVEHTGK